MQRFASALFLVFLAGLLLASYGAWLLATPDHPGKSMTAAGALIVGTGLALVAIVASLHGRRH